jgi:hypothetical protein
LLVLVELVNPKTHRIILLALYTSQHTMYVHLTCTKRHYSYKYCTQNLTIHATFTRTLTKFFFITTVKRKPIQFGKKAVGHRHNSGWPAGSLPLVYNAHFTVTKSNKLQAG